MRDSIHFVLDSIKVDTIKTTIDTVIKGDIIYLYKSGVLIERHYMLSGELDVRVVYVYKEGVLHRREWWREGRMVSVVIEN